MRYIKLFEDINNGYDVSDNDDMCFDEAEIKFSDEVSKKLTQLGFEYSSERVIITNNFPKEKVMHLYHTPAGSDIRATIVPAFDEWYYVSAHKSHAYCVRNGCMIRFETYKCDQLYGLLNCLKKECGIE